MNDVGNPQDVVECYDSAMTPPPFDVVAVEFFMGTSVPEPLELEVVAYDWAGPGNLPGALLGSEAVDPAVLPGTGGTFADWILATPITVPSGSSCVRPTLL